MSTHTQDHYKAAIKALADERKDCKRESIAPKLAEALRLAIDHMDDHAPDKAVVRAALAEWDAQS